MRMRPHQTLPKRCRLALGAVLGLMTAAAWGQHGATVVSPREGDVYYAGYEGDTIAPWAAMVLEWAYDDTTARIITPVIEISPDLGLNWVTFLRANKFRITPTKYLLRIDTAGQDISRAGDPGRSVVSDSCFVRVYEYNGHSLGGVSGVISVRLGPPPAGARNIRWHSRDLFSLSGDGSAGSVRFVLSTSDASPYGAALFAVNGRTWPCVRGAADGRADVRTPAGALVVRARSAN